MTQIFSGIQPTGRKHLGNYIGAITQYVAGQDRGEAIYCIVDLHATTVAYDPAELRERTYDTAAILLAAGLDPSRCLLFRQGDVHEHTELCWLLSSVTDSGTGIRYAEDKPGVSNLLELLAVARDTSIEEAERSMDGARGYGDLKAAVADAVVDYLTPTREHYAELRGDEAGLERVL